MGRCSGPSTWRLQFVSRFRFSRGDVIDSTQFQALLKVQSAKEDGEVLVSKYIC